MVRIVVVRRVGKWLKGDCGQDRCGEKRGKVF